MTVPVEVWAPTIGGAFTLLGILIQRGRRENADRFDRIARTLTDVQTDLRVMDKRIDVADVERAVLRNEVDTIKDRHAVVDMLHRRGVHRSNRKARGLWLALLALLITTNRQETP